jgi:hypothetical protein
MGPCTLWTGGPPAIAYSQQAVTTDGRWLLARGPESPPGSNEYEYLLYRGVGGSWLQEMTIAPPYIPSAFAAGSGWAAFFALPPSTMAPLFWYWTPTTGWTSTSTSSAPAGWGAAWASGSDYFTTGDSEVVFRFDGSTWETIRRAPAATGSVTGSGPRNDLYLLNPAGLHHFDGSTWTDVPLPTSTAPQTIARPPAGGLLTNQGYFWNGSAWANAAPTPVGCSGTVGPTPAAPLVGADSVVAIVSMNVGCPTPFQLFEWNDATRAYDFVANVPMDGDGSNLFGMAPLATTGPDGTVFNVCAYGSVPCHLASSTWVNDNTVAPVVSSAVVDGYMFKRAPFAAASHTKAYSGTDTGVLELNDAGSWSTIPGSETLTPFSLWVADDGTLFVASAPPLGASVAVDLYRYAGGTWFHDATETVVSHTARVSVLRLSNVIGRSSSDVYFGGNDLVFHWNGSAWSAMPFAAPGEADSCPISKIALGTAPAIFVTCDYGYRLMAPVTYQWDGASSYVQAGSVVGSGGTEAAPMALLVDSTGHVQWNAGSGWLTLPQPLPAQALGSTPPPTGPSTTDLVDQNNGVFARYDGTAWNTLTDQGALLLGASGVAWTDGRYVGITSTVGVAMCDLGP